MRHLGQLGPSCCQLSLVSQLFRSLFGFLKHGGVGVCLVQKFGMFLNHEVDLQLGNSNWPVDVGFCTLYLDAKPEPKYNPNSCARLNATLLVTHIL